MAETNKSQLMSEAEIIEAINANSLISVSLGAGQPQKNVKMSTLASVAAGLIPSLKLIEAPSSIDDKVSGAYFFLRNQTSGTYPDLAFNYGQLLAISQAGTTFQFLFPVTWECKIYYRLYMEGAWKAWKILLG